MMKQATKDFIKLWLALIFGISMALVAFYSIIYWLFLLVQKHGIIAYCIFGFVGIVISTFFVARKINK